MRLATCKRLATFWNELAQLVWNSLFDYRPFLILNYWVPEKLEVDLLEGPAWKVHRRG